MVDEKSVVETGAAQRGGDWPKPGEEGFVHPDGTPQSERQRVENVQAAADRAAAGSGIHGAPSMGGVAPGAPELEPSDLAAAQDEHTEWVRKAHAELIDEQAKAAEAAAASTVEKSEGRHEAPATPAVTPPAAKPAKAAE